MLKLKEKGIEIMDLDVRADVPINFILPSGAIGSGYDATILPDICAVLIDADFYRSSFARSLFDNRLSKLVKVKFLFHSISLTQSALD